MRLCVNPAIEWREGGAGVESEPVRSKCAMNIYCVQIFLWFSPFHVPHRFLLWCILQIATFMAHNIVKMKIQPFHFIRRLSMQKNQIRMAHIIEWRLCTMATIIFLYLAFTQYILYHSGKLFNGEFVEPISINSFVSCLCLLSCLLSLNLIPVYNLIVVDGEENGLESNICEIPSIFVGDSYPLHIRKID